MREDEAEARRLRDETVVLHLDVATAIALRYRNRGVSEDDLVQTACVGLVKAARDYDASRSECFLTYAVPKIRGELQRLFRDGVWMVRPPRRVQALQLELWRAASRFAQTHGHAPTIADLAEAVGLPDAAVREAMVVEGCYSVRSLDWISESGDGPLAPYLAQHDQGFDRCEALMALGPLCRRLGPDDRWMLYLRFFRGWTQARIAAEFGITQVQVSRWLSRILEELHRQLGNVGSSAGAPVCRLPAARFSRR